MKHAGHFQIQFGNVSLVTLYPPVLYSPAEETLSPLLPVNSSQQQYCITIEGDVLLAGDSWKANACTSCACNNGTIQCFSQRCPAVNCRVPVLRKGQCCPHCLGEFLGPKRESCTNTPTYSSILKYFMHVLTEVWTQNATSKSRDNSQCRLSHSVCWTRPVWCQTQSLPKHSMWHIHTALVEAANIPRASAHSHVFPVAGWVCLQRFRLQQHRKAKLPVSFSYRGKPQHSPLLFPMWLLYLTFLFCLCSAGKQNFFFFLRNAFAQRWMLGGQIL